jgi:hypothetical protein
MTIEVTIPNQFSCRPYQTKFWNYMEGGGIRAALVWHRRAGKDTVAMHWTAFAAHQRVGVYWHMLPEAKQARKVIWDGIDKQGRRLIDAVFPKVIRKSTHENDMRIELKCGSIWQLCGSDNYDSLVGSNPVGLVMSEFSIANPAAWDYIRPILAENGGWAIFPYTPRGRNHGAKMYDMARKNPSWFNEILTVDDTHAIPMSAIEEDRKSGMDESMIQQEYFCSFNAAVRGSYFGEQMERLDKLKQITRVPYSTDHLVHTWWDLGMRDSTAIWFVQEVGREIWLIDYLVNHGVGLSWYANELRSRGYAYGTHIVPHDAKVRELGTGVSRVETLLRLGIRVKVAPKLSTADQISAARQMLPRCYFDLEKCEQGIEALRMFRKEWSDELQMFSDKPLHDWSSNGSDAFKIGASAQKMWGMTGSGMSSRGGLQARADADYDEFA